MAKKKWLNSQLFSQFKTDVQEEADRKTSQTDSTSWKNPEPGTFAKPKSYTIRLLPDKVGNFYKKMLYHMFQVNGESWKFSICPKTFDQEAYCPICSVVAKLYKGSEEDKKEAYRFKRKEKYISNILVVDDPRDIDKDDNLKVSGKVMLYEFPSKVEQLIRSSINDSKNGVGEGAYDPENGYNFILNVGLTKKDAAGKEWPVYETSTFARQASSLADTDEEIDAIIQQTVDISEYLKKKLPVEDQIIEALKSENVFSLIEDDHNKKRKITNTVDRSNKKTESSVENVDEKIENDVPDTETTISNKVNESADSDECDDELFEELKRLGSELDK